MSLRAAAALVTVLTAALACDAGLEPEPICARNLVGVCGTIRFSGTLPDSTDNVFVADGSGDAKLDVAVPPIASVTVAMPGKTQAVPACLLDTYELHLVLAYHLDGKTYGKTPGTPNVIAEQLAWPLAHGKPPHS